MHMPVELRPTCIFFFVFARSFCVVGASSFHVRREESNVLAKACESRPYGTVRQLAAVQQCIDLFTPAIRRRVGPFLHLL